MESRQFQRNGAYKVDRKSMGHLETKSLLSLGDQAYKTDVSRGRGEKRKKKEVTSTIMSSVQFIPQSSTCCDDRAITCGLPDKLVELIMLLKSEFYFSVPLTFGQNLSKYVSLT